MKAANWTSGIRRIIGDILLVLTILLTVDVVVVMLHRIRTVVLKADYQEVFRYELFLCAVLLLFALDVRFTLFTRAKYLPAPSSLFNFGANVLSEVILELNELTFGK